jgi:hypothetical protein
MMEAIYEYTKSNPQYAPNRFEIVGGAEYDENFQNYIDELNQYIGGGSTLYDIDADDDNVIITIGGDLEDEIKYDNIFTKGTASTAEPGLSDMFINNFVQDVASESSEYIENEADNFYESILINGSSEIDDYRNAVEINKFDNYDSDENNHDLDVSKYFN